METARDIIDAIGKEALAKRLDLSVAMVKQARYRNQIPSSWYPVCEELAGQPLPLAAFSFKGQA
jgi:hypothetical protein